MSGLYIYRLREAFLGHFWAGLVFAFSVLEVVHARRSHKDILNIRRQHLEFGPLFIFSVCCFTLSYSSSFLSSSRLLISSTRS